MTNHLENRLAQHNQGRQKTAYTYYRRPVKVVFVEVFSDVKLAIALEKKIKGWSRAKKEALIEQNWEKLKKLSECQNSTKFIAGQRKP